jgi:3-oxoacyl-[acyl-carrier protein] reductase
MELGIRGKRALVTAASRGLGFAAASALGKEGAQVAMAARNAERLREAASEIAALGETEVVPIDMDLRKPNSIKAGVEQVLKRWDGLDILVVNTPGPPSGPFLSLGREKWQEAIDCVLMPAVDLLHAVLPAMRAGGGGRVLLITTVGVKVAQPNMVLSNTTRLALTGIAKTLSVELAKDNILVNSLCPGPIDTSRMVELIEATERQNNISRKQAEAIWLDEVPLGRMGRAEDFGRLAAVLVSDLAGFVTGAALAVDGGKSRAY